MYICIYIYIYIHTCIINIHNYTNHDMYNKREYTYTSSLYLIHPSQAAPIDTRARARAGSRARVRACTLIPLSHPSIIIIVVVVVLLLLLIIIVARKRGTAKGERTKVTFESLKSDLLYILILHLYKYITFA